MPTATEVKTFGFYLDGRWQTDGERIEICSPGTGELVGVTYRADAAQVEMAIAAAVRAFEITRKMGGFERQRILRGVAQGIETHREELARTRPDVVREVYRLFLEAKQAALAQTGVPALDPWRFGIEPNRRSLEIVIDFAVKQGLIPRCIPVDELFNETMRALG